jgi:glycosyltransferase involved in cell wall biosynthesis
MNTYAGTVERTSQSGMVDVATVDVVIAAKNEERYIGECLDALAAQSYDRRLINVFVADNGSTDRTREICKEKGAHVISCPGSTVSACRNIGIRAGTGALVAFLDAHCIAPLDWISEMVSAFAGPQVGGCQGGLIYQCTDPWTQRLCQHSILNDKKFFRHCTIHARGAAYPWIASGNAMFRRQALERVDLHDENLWIGEDVDLSWRVVLSGYQLVYANAADVVHFYTGSPLQFARRYFMYGVGGARVDRKFGLHGRELKPEKGDVLASKTLWGETLDSVRALGRWWENLRMTTNQTTTPSPFIPETVATSLREPFAWDVDVNLRISPNAIYWRESATRFCAISLAAKSRLIFQDTAASIFSCLSEAMRKDATIRALSQEYDAAPDELREALDEFVLHLIEENIVEVADYV